MTKKLNKLILCTCGCDTRMSKYDRWGCERRFIQGHQCQGRKRSDKIRKKMSTQQNEYELNVLGNLLRMGKKIPDFVNINGKKKVIEVFGDYHHRGQDPQYRINEFKSFGWDTLVVWEHELKNMAELKETLTNFHNKRTLLRRKQL